MTKARRHAATNEPIAIIGAACRLPGAADIAAFAELLGNGVDAVGTIPAERWSQAYFKSPITDQRGKSYSFAAGCLQDVAGFDAEYFGISPREAVQMDPQQRLMLELALEAMEDAGLPPSTLAGQPVGVYAGGSSSDYSTLRTGDISVGDAYFMTGVSLCSLSNRISYAFDLQGPSLTIDTACSSSLVALHLACKALTAGEVGIALVGSVNLLLSPHSFVGFSQASMLSRRGRCHAFDAAADGYVRAEGGGMLLLKPLKAAERDGDDIHAVIRATAVNSDGRTTGMSRPSVEQQAELLRGIYRAAGIKPSELAYVEAHGTGTPIGDPIEAAALGEVLGKARESQLPIGSVKTNIGHLEAASGIAGLLKLIVAIRTGAIPASLHFRTPNPHIPFDALNLRVVRERLILPPQDQIVVGINSFGFGGTNAHAILQSPPPAAEVAAEMNDPPMLLLSAASGGALAELACAWDNLLERDAGEPEAVFAQLRGAARHREEYRHRVAFIAASADGLREGIAAWLAQRAAHAVIESTALHDPGKLAFVFSGNGSQWQGMGIHAAKSNRAFRAALEQVDTLLQPLLGWSVTERLFDKSPWAGRTEIEQPLLFALQVATVRALAAYGLAPQAVAGHSVGEVAAAWAAGALSLPDAARVIVERSRQQAASSGDGAMAVLAASAAEAQTLLADWPELTIAAINARQSVTLAGPRETLAAFGARAEASKLGFVPLQVGHAFHSAAMDPVREPLLQALRGLRSTTPTCRFASSVTGECIAGPALGPEYWWRNVREPVHFAQAMQALIEDGVRVAIEIGPQAILQSFIKEAFEAAEIPGRALPSLTRRDPGIDPILIAAARCHGAGHSIAGGPLFDGTASWRRLPSYPWQKQRYWTERTAEANDHIHLAMDHALLGFRREAKGGIWFNHLDLNAQPWLGDHKVDGLAVLPAAAILDMALAAARLLSPGPEPELSDVEIRRPLVLEPDVTRQVEFSVEISSGRFSLTSQPRLSLQPPVVHATGKIVPASGGIAQAFAQAGAPAAMSMDPQEVYQITSRHGLQYGPAFRAVAGVSAAGERATVRLRCTHAVSEADRCVIDPTALDGAFQGLVALAPDRGERVTVLPVRFGRVRLAAPEGRGAPAQAHLRITAIGPRSICADFLLTSEDGLPLLELSECWFSMLNAEQGGQCLSHLLLPMRVPLPSQLPAPLTLAPFAAAPAAEPSEYRLLLEAFLSAAIHAALDARAGGENGIRPEITSPAATRPELFARALPWLEQDGLAAREDAGWRLLAPEDFPGAAALFDGFFFEGAGDSAELALAAQIATAFADAARGAEPATLPDPLIAQMLGAGRSAKAVIAGLVAAIAAQLAAWPDGKALRILEVDSGAPLTPHLLPLLRGLPACYHVLTRDGARVHALQEALSGFPEFSVRVFDEAEEDGSRFDLVAGAFLLGRDPALAKRAMRAVAEGGILLLAEGAPNRLWEAAELLGANLRAIPEEAGAWMDELTAQGLAAPQAEPIVTPLWPGCLIRALRAQPGTPALPFDKPVTFHDLGQAEPALPPTLREALLREFPHAAFTAGATEPAAASSCAVLLLPAAPADAAAMARSLDGIVQRARRLAEANAGIWLALRGSPAGAPWPEAVAGLRRVLLNELGAQCRFLLIDETLDDAAFALRLRLELGSTEPEDDVAWTPAGRFGQRLRRGLPPRLREHPVRLAIRRPGLIDTLGWVPEPGAGAPGAGEVLVEVTAAGVNFRDLMWSLGLLPDEALLGGFVGATLGLECAGRVLAAGPGAEQFTPGMRVMGFAPASFATQARTIARALVPIPDEIPDEQAATIPIAFLTAVYALGTLGQIAPGERVLIHAAAGGVGLAAVQYALHRGAEVFATAGSAAKRAVLAQLGVRHVFDSRSLAFVDDILAATDGQGVDLVLNSLSGPAMERSLTLLRPFGRFLELGKRDLYGDTPVGLRPFRNNISYFAIDVDKLPMQRPQLTQSLFEEIATLLRQGELRPLPSHVFEPAEATEAFRLMQSGSHLGKIVLRIGKQPVPEPAPAWAADPDGVYLLTGAASGFGAAAATWLARHGARHLAIISRRGAADPEAPALVAACAALGTAAEIYPCDITREADLAAILAAIRGKGAPLVGVLHAAALLDDGLLSSLDEGRFEDVLAPKLVGAELLDRLTRDDPIRLFLLFSSVAALLGNPGQANYVAANAALEGLVARRRRQGLPANAIGWAPIADAGMLARRTELGEMLTAATGVRLLPASEALDDLPAILAADLPLAVQAPIDLGAHGTLPIFRAASFRQWVRQDEALPREIHLPTLLAGMSPEEAGEFVTQILLEQIAQITRIPAARLSRDTILGDVGMDSLMMIELRLTLEQRYGVVVPMLQLAEETTAAMLARRLVHSLMADSAGIEQAMLARHEGVTLEPEPLGEASPADPNLQAGETR